METPALAFWLLLALLSLSGVVLLPPSGWLEAWTKWIATAVGVVVSARVLWAAATAFHKFAER